MNVEDEDVKLGQTLSQFKEFSADFDPTMKGLALSNSDEIRAVHNSFARQSVFEFDAKFAKEDDDVFHFVGNIITEIMKRGLHHLKFNNLVWS